MLLGKDGFGETDIASDSVLGITYWTEAVSKPWTLTGYLPLAWEWIIRETAFKTVSLALDATAPKASATTLTATAIVALTPATILPLHAVLAGVALGAVQIKGFAPAAMLLTAAPSALWALTGSSVPSVASPVVATSIMVLEGGAPPGVGAAAAISNDLTLTGVVASPWVGPSAPDGLLALQGIGAPGVAGAATVTGYLWLDGVVVFDAPTLSGHLVVLNAATLGISDYSLTPLDMAEIGGDVLLVDGAGIWRFDAVAPVDFDARLETGDLALVPGSMSTLARVYLDLDAAAPLSLTATSYDAGVPQTCAYEVPAMVGMGQRRVVKLGRGAKGTAWRIRLAGHNIAWRLTDCAARIERGGMGRVGAIRRKPG